ncbi:MAG: DUF3365 domain-containing protein [Hyphomicrobiaceae bacterium]
MRDLASTTAFIVLIMAAQAQPLRAQQPIPATTEAAVAAEKAAIGELADRLKDFLGTALKQQGALGAVGVCQSIALPTTAGIGEQRGLSIRRTSLRVRNPANAPDDFERRALEAFTASVGAGADPSTLTVSQVVIDPAGKRILRFMKAIPMAEQPCSTCHGTNIAPDVARTIQALYPQDAATGFKPGDVRGAFSVTKAIE